MAEEIETWHSGIQLLLETIQKYHLSAPDNFWASETAVLEKSYNGIGPECWPVLLRKLVSELLQIFAAGALIHDFEFSHGKKSYKHFTQANIRLAYNSAILGFIGPVSVVRPVIRNRLKLALLGILLGVLCQIFGYQSYLKGVKNV